MHHEYGRLTLATAGLLYCDPVLRILVYCVFYLVCCYLCVRFMYDDDDDDDRSLQRYLNSSSLPLACCVFAVVG